MYNSVIIEKNIRIFDIILPMIKEVSLLATFLLLVNAAKEAEVGLG